MTDCKEIIVLCGGLSSEREVSLTSGASIAEALRRDYAVNLIELNEEALPDSLHAEGAVVFPALHGGFGEDGRLQALLESSGIEYCGSDAAASRLCMMKDATKEIAQELGISVPKAISFKGDKAPLADDVIKVLGPSLVIKPQDQGSSVGLYFTDHRSALGVTLSQIYDGKWLIEERIRGRELTVGILDGKAMGIVEVVSASGIYDYDAKYTTGTTEYRFPAEISDALTRRIQIQAEQIFSACGCRDFARADFLLDGENAYFLEINTLPGLTATSLLPKSARCNGLDFEALAKALVLPAIKRLSARRSRDSK